MKKIVLTMVAVMSMTMGFAANENDNNNNNATTSAYHNKISMNGYRDERS